MTPTSTSPANKPLRISVAMLAHNEEKLIGETLVACSFADEIIVVDAESSDATVEICRSHGATVISRPNIHQLNTNKNVAIDACRGEWILYLDADERITPESRDEIVRIIESGKHDAYLFPRLNYILGKPLRWGGNYPDWQLRLFRRGVFRFPEAHIHERVAGTGTIGKLKYPMLHESYPEAYLLIRKLWFNASFEAKFAYEQGKRPTVGLAWQWLFWKPVTRFVERYLLKLGFLNGFAGVAAVAFDAMNFMVRYLYLVELNRSGKVNNLERVSEIRSERN